MKIFKKPVSLDETRKFKSLEISTLLSWHGFCIYNSQMAKIRRKRNGNGKAIEGKERQKGIMKPDKLNKPDKPEKLNRPEKREKPEKPDKPDKPNKPERLNRPKRPDSHINLLFWVVMSSPSMFSCLLNFPLIWGLR